MAPDSGDHLRLILGNIYPAAWGGVSPAESFPWHKGAQRPHSSQALAVDVFGTLKMLDQDQKDTVLTEFAASLGFRDKGPWSVELEWLDDGNLLMEKRRTQVDVLLRGSESVVCVECKFTEATGGACSQTRPLKKGGHMGVVQCGGDYTDQSNPVTQATAKCALSGKGIRYWDLIPEVFKYSAGSDYRPCPFAGAEFQWMRNMVLAYEAARERGCRPVFVLMYADSPALHITQYLADGAWQDFLATVRREVINVQSVAFQDFVMVAGKALDAAGRHSQAWQGLGLWVGEKIDRATAHI